MARKTPVGGNVVRAWAQSDEGQAVLAQAETPVTVGLRGKFSQPLIDAFHKANPTQKYEVGHVPTIKVKGVRTASNGRRYGATVTTTLTEIRAFAKAEGLPIGDRGRIAKEVKEAFVASTSPAS